ncbi:MAG: LemA family protein [Alphaproteobacteria bacterium]
MIVVYVLIGIAALVIVVLIALFNRLVGGRNQVEAAWQQIDVQLRRRYDLIPNLVQVVKDYMAYERETLEAVVDARNKAMQASEGGSREARIEAENALSGVLGRLFALAEAYPDLKANQNVSQLQEELTTTENKIAFARQFYNDAVQAQNTRVESFPSNLVARRFGFGRHPYFETPPETREAIKVTLR